MPMPVLVDGVPVEGVVPMEGVVPDTGVVVLVPAPLMRKKEISIHI
jgi:hypothetical protein